MTSFTVTVNYADIAGSYTDRGYIAPTEDQYKALLALQPLSDELYIETQLPLIHEIQMAAI